MARFFASSSSIHAGLPPAVPPGGTGADDAKRFAVLVASETDGAEIGEIEHAPEIRLALARRTRCDGVADELRDGVHAADVRGVS